MPPDLLAALAVFAFVSSITPGPNNLMLLASGANFGFRRSVPHMLGIGAGFTALVAMAGLGLAGLFTAWPPARPLLQTAAVAYMLWLAWKIANAAPPAQGQAGSRPLTFMQAAAFQWVNPKGWTMALGAVSLYAPGQQVSAVLWVAGVFGLMIVPCVSSWTVLGLGIRRALKSPARLRAFNWTMAALLIASLYPVLAG